MDDKYQLLRRFAGGEGLPDSIALRALITEFDLECSEAGDCLSIENTLELLDPEKLQVNLSAESKQHLSALDLQWSLDSTNSYVLGLNSSENFHGYACIAERQTAGRGRRGRNWVSPFGKNIYLSLGWRLNNQPLSGLSLAVGCCVARAITSLSNQAEVKLKWPNDILINGGKTAGILVEVASGIGGRLDIVVGVGVNLQLSKGDTAQIEQPWSVIDQVSRNMLASQLLSELVLGLVQFEERGFSPFAEEWNSLDAYADQKIDLIAVNDRATGICRGVDGEGNLLFEVGDELRRVNAGEVSMRGAS